MILFSPIYQSVHVRPKIASRYSPSLRSYYASPSKKEKTSGRCQSACKPETPQFRRQMEEVKSSAPRAF
ncbi:hypothetical protein HBI56_027270 [Parastagonospora nodorum]|nr:hypothetical protein HBH53_031920 [Parastagonospora nodorum]KAH3969244.1 hypothetical protein HBH51_124090 [Parastagonospora nodorum]KAH3990332.1 hypothetical protein HBH52_008930 [Parastagonospora nodorum]KAH4006620.1 hypothetical protein HBI10_019350 [Parastagonospora nodorum]KAH4015314.1 hypothetical protein HBI13_161290 [Parastagonospora nodorum]